MRLASLLSVALAIACSGSANGVAVDGVLNAVAGTTQACQAGSHGAHCEETSVFGTQGTSSMHRADARDAPEMSSEPPRARPPRAVDDEPDSQDAATPSQPETLPARAHGSERLPARERTIWSLLTKAIQRIQSECPSSRTTHRSGDISVHVLLSFDPDKQLRHLELQLEPRFPTAFSSPAPGRKDKRESTYQDRGLSQCIEAILRKLDTPSEPPPEPLSFELVVGG
jgi:hypothetical protein